MRSYSGDGISWYTLTIGSFGYCIHDDTHVQCRPTPIGFELSAVEGFVPAYMDTLLRPAMVYISLSIGLTAGISSVTMYCISTLGVKAPHIRGLQVWFSIVALMCSVYPMALIFIMYKHFSSIYSLSVEFGTFFPRCLVAVSCSFCLVMLIIVTRPHYTDSTR